MKLTAIAALGVLALSGCMPSAPIPASVPSVVEPDASSAATAEPAPVPVAASLVISGLGISVLDETSTVMVDIPFGTDGAAAAAELAVALGVEPTETTVTGSDCQRPGTLYDWGGFALESAGTITMAPPGVFSVAADAATAAGVAVYGPHNLQVGARIATVLAADPGGVSYDYGDGWALVALDATDESGFDVTGTRGVVYDEVLTVIEAPVYVFGDC